MVRRPLPPGLLVVGQIRREWTLLLIKEIPELTAQDVARFWSKIGAGDGNLDAGGCWLWQGTIDRYGYGRLSVAGRLLLAHRVAYSQEHGAIEFGQLDHICTNKRCVNPAHLETVDNGENGRRGSRTGPTRYTHCKHGHQRENNSKVDRRGKRYCSACNSEQSLASYHRRRRQGNA